MSETVRWIHVPGARVIAIEAPHRSTLAIRDDLVSKTAHAFTLPLGQCDFSSAVGHSADRMRPGVPAAADYAEWLRELPRQVRFVSRVCVVRTWNPEGTIVPASVEQVDAHELTPDLLTSLPEERLLAVDFAST